ncbi:hypothetical protein PJ311_01325 [Bacillus sp. CLL-7-23]|uniref:Uncharacterized protein n=1 Tax=Bacillus changyiensis TaxID=3004103 RepID=A0ABT4WYX6_9BACI|nr:hypothetical protein [Bacillus changyiensis]MDA7025246.1 hypothetical protein [Bacillus changyiensis]
MIMSNDIKVIRHADRDQLLGGEFNKNEGLLDYEVVFRFYNAFF